MAGDIRELIRLARTADLRPPDMVSNTHPVDQIDDAIAEVAQARPSATSPRSADQAEPVVWLYAFRVEV